MSRRVAILRANTYDEVRGAVLDAIAIAQDAQVPDRLRVAVFEKAYDGLISGQAIHEQIQPHALLQGVSKVG